MSGVLCSAEGQTQGFVHARQALYQESNSSGPMRAFGFVSKQLLHLAFTNARRACLDFRSTTFLSWVCYSGTYTNNLKSCSLRVGCVSYLVTFLLP